MKSAAKTSAPGRSSAARTGGAAAASRPGPQRPARGTVQRAVQSDTDRLAVAPKLVLGTVNDPAEREADRAAAHIMAGRPAEVVGGAPPAPMAMAAEPDESVRRQPVDDVPVRRQAMDVAHVPGEAPAPMLQRRPRGPAPGRTVPRVAAAAIRAPGAGTPLPSAVRARLEAGFGADLRGVRVHQDPRARATSAALMARAFTYRDHIWLGPGESAADLSLMAHEAAHVLQQRQGDPVVRRRAGPDAASAPAPAPAPAPEAPPSAAEATGPASATASRESPAAGPDLLVPAPSDGPTRADRARLDTVRDAASTASEATADLPPGSESVAGARAAVSEPQEEADARAAARLTAELGAQAAPSPEIEALCAAIRAAVARRLPSDEDGLAQFQPRQASQAAGAELNAAVEGDANRVRQGYDGLAAPPAGTPSQTGQPFTPPSESVATPPLSAGQATPDPVPGGTVDLSADVTASQARIDEAGMSTEAAAVIRDPANPVTQARDAQGAFSSFAETDPAAVLAEQEEARSAAQARMQALQARALEALQTARQEGAQDTATGMAAMGQTEAQMRRTAAAAAQRIFTETQTTVQELLRPLASTAMTNWETGVALLATQVEQESERFKRWKRDRYAGVTGAVTEIVDAVVGLPDWAVRWLDRIERNFTDGVCRLLRRISREVNTVIATCERLIASAERRIGAIFDTLPTSLQDWAETERARFDGQLAALRTETAQTRDGFTRDVSGRAVGAVREVRGRIHQMRQEARGLLGRISDAITAFVEDPGRVIVEGLLQLVGIEPAAFFALIGRLGSVIDAIADQPMRFAQTLALGLKQGFGRFFESFPSHVLGGFFSWLFSGLGAVGVQVPGDLSPASLFGFFLELMGITWANIRQILARKIGARNLELIERAWSLASMLIERGIDGVAEMIRAQLSPQALIDAVLSAAVDFLIETLITTVTPRIIGLFNPAGAVVEVVRVIFTILQWVFNNAARIFSLVETIVGGAQQIIAGNTAALAGTVEAALARTVPIVIDFLAGYAGLGGLPRQVADTVGGLQRLVLGAIERALDAFIRQARAILQRMQRGRGADRTNRDPTSPAPRPGDHRGIARAAARDLKRSAADAQDYATARAAVEAAQQGVIARYQAMLEDGIAIRIRLTDPARDRGDDDLDLRIIIAPNTTIEDDQIPVENPFGAEEIFEAALRLYEQQRRPVTRLSPHSITNGRRELLAAFTDARMRPSVVADTMRIINQLLMNASRETTGDGITNRLASVSGVANAALQAQGSHIRINAHHLDTVSDNPGTFRETRRGRLHIPAQIRRAIDAWAAQPGRTETQRREIVNIVRDQLIELDEESRSGFEQPLRQIEMIVATQRLHAAHHAREREEQRADDASRPARPGPPPAPSEEGWGQAFERRARQRHEVRQARQAREREDEM